MSFGGYFQILCKSGHLEEIDCQQSLEGWHCSVCAKGETWHNLVDQTSGSYYYDELLKKDVRIDGHVELEIKNEEEYEKCDKCNFSSLKKYRTYKVPKKSKKDK